MKAAKFIVQLEQELTHMVKVHTRKSKVSVCPSRPRPTAKPDLPVPVTGGTRRDRDTGRLSDPIIDMMTQL